MNLLIPSLPITSIQIQTIDYCNRKCPWCPNKYLNKTSDMIMTEEIFHRILNQLKKLNYRGAIHPYLMGEPLADTRFIEHIQVIREMFPLNAILINTNGDFINSYHDVEPLFEAGLSRLIINVYSADRKFLFSELGGIPRVTVNWIGTLRKMFFNRGGLLSEKNRLTVRSRICSYILRKMCINYLGDVILCCADYFYQVVFGNVMEMDLWDIWTSERYVYYRTMHRQGKGYLRPLCSECNRIHHPPGQSEDQDEIPEAIPMQESIKSGTMEIK